MPLIRLRCSSCGCCWGILLVRAYSFRGSANKTLFEWAIENLCKNATDAMKGNGKIEFDITSNDYEVDIFIKDYGQGIAKNKINQIFLPGYTSKKSGWGLGLSLTKRIIEEYHSGKIFVSSSEENYGTTFCIKLKKYS